MNRLFPESESLLTIKNQESLEEAKNRLETIKKIESPPRTNVTNPIKGIPKLETKPTPVPIVLRKLALIESRRTSKVQSQVVEFLQETFVAETLPIKFRKYAMKP